MKGMCKELPEVMGSEEKGFFADRFFHSVIIVLPLFYSTDVN